MSEWKECTLGDVLNFRRGHDLPKSSMANGIIPVAGSNGIIGWHDTYTDISPVITVGRSGSIGHPYIYEKAWAHNTTLYIDDFKGNDPKYLYYLLFTLPLEQWQAGSAVPTLNRNHIHPLPIIFPNSIEVQKKIASILSSLDEKIETNRKINARLEELAQALFKSWFIDFEPFGGKMPKDWKEGTIMDMCPKIASGSTPSSMNKEFYNGKIRWFTTKELKDNFLLDSEKHISEEAHSSSSTKIFPKGTVLMAIYAAPTVGRLGILTSDSTFNQAAVGLYPKEEIGTIYLYQYLLNERLKFNNLAVGAAQQNLSVKFVKEYICKIPSKEVLDKYNGIINPIFVKIHLLSKESGRLAEMRDTLLQKLMSGELIPE